MIDTFWQPLNVWAHNLMVADDISVNLIPTRSCLLKLLEDNEMSKVFLLQQEFSIGHLQVG